MHRPYLPSALVALACTTCLAAGVAVTGPANGADAEAVSLVVELDLPNAGGSGPRVFEVTGVTPGPGAELTNLSEVSNPSQWCGTISVDVDPAAKSITVAPDSSSTETPCDFETVSVTLNAPGLTGISRTSGDLLVGAGAAATTRTAAVVDGGVRMTWTTAPDEPLLLSGTETFDYTVLTQPTPPVTTPASTTSPPTTPPTTSPATAATTPAATPPPSASATSAPATSAPGPTSFSPVKKPLLEGRAVVGRTLRVRNVGLAGFVPPASKVTVTWFRAGKRIRGASGLSYKVVDADGSKRLKVQIIVRGAAPSTTFVLRSKKIVAPSRQH